MKKKDDKDQVWYLSKRLWEGQGIFRRITEKIDKGEPLVQLGNDESRKIRPLTNIRNFFKDQEERDEDKKEGDTMVKLNFEELSDPIKKHAKQEAKKKERTWMRLSIANPLRIISYPN